MKRNRQYITDKILQVRKDICKFITEEMTVRQAYEKLGYTEAFIGNNSFYQQCKALVALDYVIECGYRTEGKAHSLCIKAIKFDYTYDPHAQISVSNKKESIKILHEEKHGASRTIRLTDTTHWNRQNQKTGRVHVSGGSLNMVMATTGY